jgi:hypothetical protein
MSGPSHGKLHGHSKHTWRPDAVRKHLSEVLPKVWGVDAPAGVIESKGGIQNIIWIKL